jgi:uncharacterized protein
MQKTFLSAYWKNLIMANHVVDPSILEKYVPYGTELDYWNGETYVSLVGFMFLDTKVLGLSIPFHRNFEEVNLRFYVRRKEDGEWKRGVVFIKEIVPRVAIAGIARWLYGEPYVRLPMRNELRQIKQTQTVTYSWKFRGEWNSLQVVAGLSPQPIGPGTEEEFITEHYWGYTRLGAARTSAYQVEHPRWNVFPVIEYSVNCDVAALYGPEFAQFMNGEPHSIFMADGSQIKVMKSAKPHN